MWGLQSPDEVLDWHQDWSDWMEAGDAIDTSSWTIEPDTTAVLTDQGIDNSSHLTTVFVSSLSAGQSYQLKNTITTLMGRTGVREITLRCDIQ